MTSPVSRRSIAKGAAWTVPAVAAASLAPAASASTPAGITELTYLWQLVTDTHDPNSPGTSYCTAPLLTMTNTSTNGDSIVIDKVAAWNDVLQSYTFPMTSVGATLAPGASLPVGGDGSGTLDPNQDYYALIKWTDTVTGVTTTTVSCPITSDHAACGAPNESYNGTSTNQVCALPAGVSLPAGW